MQTYSASITVSLLAIVTMLPAASGPSLPTSLAPSPSALEGIQLVDQAGRPIAANSFGSGPVLINFVFTKCPVACPRQTQELRSIFEALPPEARARVQFLSITVDPEHDSPEALRSFAARMKVTMPNWRFATGKPAEIRRLLQRMSVMDPSKVNPQPIDHRLTLFLFNREGLPVIRYHGSPIDRERLAADLTQLARLP